VDVVLVDGSLSVGDNLPPYLVVTDPSDGSYSNDLYEPISIVFNEAMDPGSLDVQSTPSLVYTTSWSENGQVAYLYHDGLGSSTVYTFTVSGSDLTTIPMTETVTWVFTTTYVDDVAPSVLGAFPENGGLGVVLTPTIQITFSEQIPPGDAFIEITPDPIGAHNYDLSMNATWNDSRTVMTTTVNFPLFPETTYTIRVDASDRSGNPLAAPFQWSFTTLRAERKVYLPFVTR
jgi:hypothetical protein